MAVVTTLKSVSFYASCFVILICLASEAWGNPIQEEVEKTGNNYEIEKVGQQRTFQRVKREQDISVNVNQNAEDLEDNLKTEKRAAGERPSKRSRAKPHTGIDLKPE